MTPAVQTSYPATPFSVFQPSESDDSFTLSRSRSDKKSTPRDKLNLFLASRDISPIRSSLSSSWDKVSERTRRHYTRKAKQVVFAALEEIAPENSEVLFSAVKTAATEDANVDSTLMEALAECYNNANHWSIWRQILSIMADKISFHGLQNWIPGLSRYMYNTARHHVLLHGRGTLPPPSKNTRVYVSPEKLDHFITFITSAQVMQDLPFGEKVLKLSSGTEIKIPNVVRNLIPEQTIQQYRSYCKDTSFTPMSRSTLSRILKACSASIRKSLQGLDYIAADGAKAFDELQDVVEKMARSASQSLAWSTTTIDKLKQAKRYLKGDYKVYLHYFDIKFCIHCVTT